MSSPSFFLLPRSHSSAFLDSHRLRHASAEHGAACVFVPCSFGVWYVIYARPVHPAVGMLDNGGDITPHGRAVGANSLVGGLELEQMQKASADDTLASPATLEFPLSSPFIVTFSLHELCG